MRLPDHQPQAPRAAQERHVSGASRLTIQIISTLEYSLKRFFSASSAVPQKLEAGSTTKMEKLSYLHNEPVFRWDMFDDEMAHDKLYEGIRGFAKDGESVWRAWLVGTRG